MEQTEGPGRGNFMSAASLRLPGWQPTANRVVKLMNRLGVPLGTIRVLEIPGRVSGLSRATPVSLLLLFDRRFVIAGLPEADWALNARAAAYGDLVRGRRREPVRLVEVDDPALRREVMRAFPAEVPGGVPFFVKIGLVTGADAEQFAAAADQVAVFELVPADDDPRDMRKPGPTGR
jgi:hypothetical protein